MAEHPNAQLIRTGYQAFSRGDMATLSELFAKDIQWHEAGGASTPVAGDHKGQDAVFGMFGTLIQQTAEFRVTLEELVADDYQAVAIHEVYARRGATSYCSREAIVFHLLDGKVTDAWHTVPDLEAYDMFWAAPNDMSIVEQNIANCKRGYAAFATGDIETLNDVLDENVVWHVTGGSPLDGDYQGRDATYAFFAQLAQDTAGTLKIELHDVLANEEHVTALCTTTATRNGKTMSDTGVQVFHVRDGKVTEAWFTTTNAKQAVEFWQD
jgi:ketosteroid isomerase-like protein